MSFIREGKSIIEVDQFGQRKGTLHTHKSVNAAKRESRKDSAYYWHPKVPKGAAATKPNKSACNRRKKSLSR